jgi:hypothetical protein
VAILQQDRAESYEEVEIGMPVLWPKVLGLIAVRDARHFGYQSTRQTPIKFKPCAGINKDEHKDVKATVQRIHAAEFAKKSALKLATAQGSRKLTESLRVNEFVTVEGRTFALGADEHRKIMKAVEARWDMLHSDLQSAAYILNPRYRHTHDFSGSAMQAHDALLQKWLSEDDLHTYKAEFGSYKEKTDIFSAQTIWTDKALEVDAHVWWDYWASGKKVLHDFATRVTSQPVSIGSAERCWKAYANIHCAKRNRLGPGRAAKLTCVHYNMRLRHAREDPTFEPECLPPMELDPIDAEADDFDESE